MSDLQGFVASLRSYDEAGQPADGWCIAYNDLQEAADTIERLEEELASRKAMLGFVQDKLSEKTKDVVRYREALEHNDRLLRDIRDDLILRSEEESESDTVVDISGSIWNRLNDSIDEARIARKALDHDKDNP